jgi:RimJ/RimL family protein N-acetyltransferase
VESSRVQLKDGRLAVIRKAVPDDAQSITEFVNIVGAEEKFVPRDRATWTLEEERATLAAADGRHSVFFVAEISGRVSGLINLARGRWSKDAHRAEFGMSCLPETRRIGLGTALLSRGILWARSVGVKKLALEVFATNEGAVALYRKSGFVEEARLRGEYVIEGRDVDSFRMVLWL